MDKQPKKQNQEPSLKEQFTSRAFRAGTYSVVISLLAVAVVVIINLIAAKLPTTITRIDLTDSDLLALSEQTKQLVSGLDQDVTVYQIVENDGDEDEYISELLSRYSDLSKHFKYQSINVVLYPNFISQFTQESLYKNSLVVVSDKRATTIDYFDIYQYSFKDNSTDENVQVDDIQFYGEQKLTTAVDFVTTDVLPVVYNITGHGEGEYSDLLKELIAGDNMNLQNLSLMQQGGVPEDASVVVINAPALDISDDERDMILAYLEQGGKLLLITDYTKNSDLPNIFEVMDFYGMTTKPSVVLEGDTNRYYSSGLYILPEILAHDVTRAIRAGGYFVMSPVTMPIYEKPQHRESLTLETLLKTSDAAFVKEDFDNRTSNEKEKGDESGPFSLGMAATDEHDGTVTQLVWFGSGFLLDENINAAVSGTNNDLFLASLGWMTGSDTAISIHSKSLSYEDLNVSAAAANIWSLLFVIVIPVVLLGVGGIILYRRRKR